MSASECTVREIAWGSADYRAALALRNAVLRAPLGLDLLDEDLAPEREYCHVGAFWGDRLVGTLLFIDRGEGLAQMRQVAVADDCRRLGIGRQMIVFGEALLRARGFGEVVLEARKTALGFYQALGYRVAGEEVLELGIPHCEMRKPL